MEIKDFFEKMWGKSLNDLKEFVEETNNKESMQRIKKK
jgi:hypothetical protein